MKDLKLILILGVPEDKTPADIFHQAKELIADTGWLLKGGFAAKMDEAATEAEDVIITQAASHAYAVAHTVPQGHKFDAVAHWKRVACRCAVRIEIAGAGAEDAGVTDILRIGLDTALLRLPTGWQPSEEELNQARELERKWNGSI